MVSFEKKLKDIDNTFELENGDNKIGDDESSCSARSRHSMVAGMQHSAARVERETLAKNETRAVGILRLIMLGILLLTGAIVSFLVFRFTRHGEVHDLREAFAANAARVIDAFRESLEAQLGAMDALSVTITSHALATNSTFPFVTVPHWELRGCNSRILAKGFLAHYAPVVTEDQLDAWAEYSANNVHDFDRSLEAETRFRKKQDAEFGLTSFEQTYVDDQGEPFQFKPNIWGPPTSVKPNFTDVYLPIWQFSPPVPFMKGSLNFDITRFGGARAENIEHAFTTERAALSRLFAVPRDPGDSSEVATDKTADTILRSSQLRHKVGSYTNDAISVLNYPVFDSFEDDRKLVGLLSSNPYWRSFFTNVLPENAVGIICVLRNTANQTFTYRIDGHNAYILGNGDLHDSAYDDLVWTAEITSYVDEMASPETRSYTAVGLDPDNIQHHIFVYPSKDTVEQFVTTKPYIYGSVVAFIFIFSASIFLLYDYLVEKRQVVVMDRAVKSTAVVSSLFPEEVRDRLLEQAEKDQNEYSKNEGSKGAVFKRSTTNDIMDDQHNEQTFATRKIVSTNSPIADRFAQATVFFADIVGFTSWSSKREAEGVFQLLEALFGKLDAIALRRKVFKVETIGDCYMAVTGVPKHQPDHATIMAKFARDCIINMRNVFSSLAEDLGPDTVDLSMRIGLHSGEVTAGVLRGEKSRFQLFGDTVNTAARMESLGIPGRIHCSQSTADELISSGHGNWLVARQGLVKAKGKGEMQTYFVDGIMKGTATASVGSTCVLSMERDSSTKDADHENCVEIDDHDDDE